MTTFHLAHHSRPGTSSAGWACRIGASPVAPGRVDMPTGRGRGVRRQQVRRRQLLPFALVVPLAALAAAPMATAAARAAAHPARGRVVLTAAADPATVARYQDVGFTLTVANPTGKALDGVRLTDLLPAGGDLSWAVSDQRGVAGCRAAGAVGEQRLACPAVSLPAHGSYTLRVYSHTSAATSPAITDTAEVAAAGGARAARTATATVAAAADCRQQAPDPSRDLLFDDEFDGPSVDTSKWTNGTLPFSGLDGSKHYHNRQYGSYVEPGNAVTRDGVLDLTTNDVPVTDPDVPAIGTIPYTEGMVTTKGTFATTGGYFEICAKFPAGRGMWPAFWLAAANGQWPPEIDVAEWFGSLEAMQIGQPFATGANAGNQWLSTWRYDNAATTGYHDYAVWWSDTSPATIRYSIDGRMVHEVDGTTATTIPNTPMYLILNSGTWAPATRGGPPDATTVFPNAFQVDYVRVYRTPPPQQPYSAP